MKFTKMHGTGNDYVYINDLKNEIENPSELSIKISCRNFSVGSDGLILIKNSQVADFKMEMYNADGSQAEMCGNGIRCLGKFVFDKDLVKKQKITVETLAGIKTLLLFVENNVVKDVSVSMGSPSFKTKDVKLEIAQEEFIFNVIKAGNIGYKSTCVSMGNPHCVIFESNIDDMDLENISKSILYTNNFKEGANIELVEIISKNEINMRVFERGSGETLSCGTGACAAVVAAYKSGLCNDEVVVNVRGGKLIIKYDTKLNDVILKGPATLVFEGELKIN